MHPRLRSLVWPSSWCDFVPERGPFLVNIVALGYFYVALARYGFDALDDTKGVMIGSLLVAALSWLLCLALCRRRPGEKPERGRWAYVALSGLALLFGALLAMSRRLGPN